MLEKELMMRIKCLQNAMKKHSLDAYIITAEEDIWYFTNVTFKPEERPFFIIISLDCKPVLLVPKLEEAHVHKGILDCDIITYWDYPSPNGSNWFDILHQLLKKFNHTGIENNVKAEVYLKIQAKNLLASHLVADQRQLKSAYELEKIRFSAKQSDMAIEKILQSSYKGAGVVESFSISNAIQKQLIRSQQFDPITTSLTTIVWPAPLSSMPHSIPSITDKLGEGPQVSMAYFRINGYASECERTFFLDKPTKEEQELFHHMLRARDQSLKILKPGVRASDVDCEARNYLAQHGLINNTLHRTGHGIGLSNHEGPFIAEGSDDILQENMIITIEPGIYFDGKGGFRHSDTILITNDGYELLTHAPLDLNSLVIEKMNIQSKLKGSVIRKSLNLNKK
ncbi:M24 family metallopeptidase [Lysinibacillus sp. NPDC097214]|uniref:M24 family metallopeptidase n=1 Tax=Lysinibacillus sp. NPDC097214 TaxID=3390584 RepID=UPI003D059038